MLPFISSLFLFFIPYNVLGTVVFQTSVVRVVTNAWHSWKDLGQAAGLLEDGSCPLHTTTWHLHSSIPREGQEPLEKATQGDRKGGSCSWRHTSETMLGKLRDWGHGRPILGQEHPWVTAACHTLMWVAPDTAGLLISFVFACEILNSRSF